VALRARGGGAGPASKGEVAGEGIHVCDDIECIWVMERTWVRVAGDGERSDKVAVANEVRRRW
jgi:hypothetical protein